MRARQRESVGEIVKSIYMCMCLDIYLVSLTYYAE